MALLPPYIPILHWPDCIWDFFSGIGAVHNFLVIKEPRTENRKEAQITDIGRNISFQMWKH
eukprot:11008408-Ditylum_brightwellii.AAC.1